MSKRRLLNIAALVCGVAVLAGTIWQIGWQNVLAHVETVGAGFLLLIALQLVSALLDAWSLRVALGGGVGIGRLLGVGLAGAAVNQFTPLGEGGEVLKGNMLLGQVPGERAVSAVFSWNLAHRVSKHLTIFLGPLLMFAVEPERFGVPMLLAFVLAGVIATVPTALLFLLAWSRGAERVVGVLRRVPWVKRRVSDRLLAKARETDGLVREFSSTRRRDAAVMVGIQIGAKLLWIFDYWVVQQMLDVDMTIVEAAFMVSGAQILGVALAVSPVQIGVTEAGEAGLWALLGLPVDVGFAQAFVRRLRSLVIHFAGLVYLGFEGFRRRPSTAAREALP